MDSFSYLNGEIIPAGQACVSIYDRGLFYGDGLFETVRIYKGLPFLIENHLQRLIRGAVALGISFPGKKDDLMMAVMQTLEANRLREGVIRLTLTRGSSVRGLWPEKPGEPTLIITAESSVPYTDKQYKKGFRAALISFPLNEYSPLSGIKTLNYLEYIIGRRESLRRGFDEGIFLNQKRYLAEGTVSNLFLVKGKKLYTPPVEAGILPGITRAMVIKIAKKSFDVSEQNISPLFIKEAEEAFFTNSLMEIMPLVEIEEKSVGNGKPGTVTAELHSAYRAFIKESLKKMPLLPQI